MTDLPQAAAPNTEAYLASAGPRLADLCTACGACFKACPIAAHLKLPAEAAGAITDGLRQLARGEPASAPTVAWVGACGKSGQCIAACPERDKGLDAMLLVRIARQNAINQNSTTPGQAGPDSLSTGQDLRPPAAHR